MKRLEVTRVDVEHQSIICKEEDGSYCDFFCYLSKLWFHKKVQGWKMDLILGDELDSDRETWEIVWEK